MKQISIEPVIKELVPGLCLYCISSDVKWSDDNPELWAEIDRQLTVLAEKLNIEDISKIPTISASRKAYKACGKDPARYRLSAEALLRRVANGKGLYRISNVVDQLNLVSVTSGFSIGGYDEEQIVGNIHLGIGAKDEPYQGIGRGELNIAGLPVFRDDLGAFGTPTSDSERTSVSEKTHRFLMIIIDFGGQGELENAGAMAVGLLKKYCHAQHINVQIIK